MRMSTNPAAVPPDTAPGSEQAGAARAEKQTVTITITSAAGAEEVAIRMVFDPSLNNEEAHVPSAAESVALLMLRAAAGDEDIDVLRAGRNKIDSALNSGKG